MLGEHSHWERYYVREISGWAYGGNHNSAKLQLICLMDGIIFQEVEIRWPEENTKQCEECKNGCIIPATSRDSRCFCSCHKPWPGKLTVC